MCEAIHFGGQHVVYTNEAGSVHFTRYPCGCTDPMIDPSQETVVEYAPGYLENKAERDRRYQEALRSMREGPPKRRGFLSWLFGRPKREGA